MCPRNRPSRLSPRASPNGQEFVRTPPLVVKHNYHDFSEEPIPDNAGPVDMETLSSEKSSFPMKLFYMLDDVQAKGLESIVSWQVHGRSFLVHKAEEFKDLLPQYFKLSKIASFLRQLNLYGFIRLTRGVDRGSYYHECFLRGKPFLLTRMHRIKVKGTGVRARSDPEHEPDFWSMKSVGSGQNPEQMPVYPVVPVRTISSDASLTAVSVSSAESAKCDIKQPKEKKPKKQQRLDASDKRIEKIPLSPTSVMAVTDSLAYWAAPIASSELVDYDRIEGYTMDDLVDDSYLDQTLYDILKETDVLFPDMLDMLAS